MHPYFTQVDEVADEERIYVRSFFGHVDLSRWREAPQEERDAHQKRMEEREQEGGEI